MSAAFRVGASVRIGAQLQSGPVGGGGLATRAEARLRSLCAPWGLRTKAFLPVALYSQRAIWRLFKTFLP